MSAALEFHPLADIFPPMEDAEFDALVADIKANGLYQAIILHGGMLLDGRNRYRACLAAGVEPTTVNGDEWIDDPATYVISANIHRRHLTAEQKRELIANLLKADPGKSDRQIAEAVKASPTTVGTVRAEIASTVQSGQLPQKRIGKDGKARKQPKPRDLKQERRAREVRKLERRGGLPSADELMNASDERLEEIFSATAMIDRLREQLRAAEIKIAGLESENGELRTEREQLRARVAELEVVLAASGQTEKPKRGRRRPKGSKNKPKPPIAPSVDPITVSVDMPSGNDPGPMPEFLDRTRGAAA